jgi:hypothetical protein
MKPFFSIVLKLFGEIFFALFILWVIGISFVFSALKNNTLPYPKIISYVEETLENRLNVPIVKIDDMNIKWHMATHKITLFVDGIQVAHKTEDYAMLGSVETDIYPMSLIFGRIRFGDLNISDVFIQTEKDRPNSVENVSSSNEPARSYATLSNLIYDIPVFNTLHVNNMFIDMHDTRLGPIKADAQLVQSGLNRNVKGSAFIPFLDDDGSQVKIDFETKDDPLSIEFSGQFDRISMKNIRQFFPSLDNDIDVIAQAKLSFSMDNLWRVNALAFDLENAEGAVHIPQNTGKVKIPFSGVTGRIEKSNYSDIYNLTNIKFMIFENSQIELNATIDIANGIDALQSSLSVKLDQLLQQKIETYWPDTNTDNGAYRWLVQKMKGGLFKNIHLSMGIDRSIRQLDKKNELPAWITNIKTTFDYEDLVIDYRDPLDMANATKGSGIYDGRTLKLDIQESKINNMEVKNAVIDLHIVDGTEDGTAYINIPLTGSLKDLLGYIEKEPINAMDRIDVDLTKAKGTTDVNVKLELPMDKDVKIEQIKVDVSAQLSDVQIPNLVRGLTLSGGPYDLLTNGDVLELKGKGFLSGAPITLNFKETISTGSANDMTIDATLNLNDKIRQAYLSDIATYFSGGGTAIIKYKENGDNTSGLGLKLDLKQSKIDVASIGYKKENGSNLNISTNIKLHNDSLQSIDSIALNGTDISLGQGDLFFEERSGEVFITKGTLKNLVFDRNDMTILLNEKNRNLNMKITGKSFDVTSILAGSKVDVKNIKESRTTRPIHVDLEVNQLYVSETHALNDAILLYKNNEMRDTTLLNLDAKAGSGNLMVRYDPNQINDNGLTLRVESDNAGDTLRMFDLYSDVQGGRLRIAGVPMDNGSFGDVRGQLRIDNFKVDNNPILIRLLNAISLKGLGNTLEFKRLESDFEWRLSANGDMYVVRNGTTSGSSVGLTFDGVVDTSKDDIDIQGTIAPLSALNNFIGKIPVIGDILTGGGGALLAATYAIKGDIDDVSVSVNPLSVLTPGIVRKMLFERSVDIPNETQKSQDTAIKKTDSLVPDTR